MAEYPYMPFFVDAYMLDAGHLTEQEHGAYLRLLIMAWTKPECRLPNDDAWLARHFSRSVETIREVYRPIIAEFFQTDGNWLWQKRQKAEWEHARKISKKQSDNAKSRWVNGKGASHGNAMGMPPKPKPRTPTDVGDSPPVVPPQPEEPAAAAPQPPSPAAPAKPKRAKSADGSRIPDGWKPTQDGLRFAASIGMSPGEVARQVGKFCDYWPAQTGAKARKADWDKTWRVWCRTYVDWRQQRAGPARGDPIDALRANLDMMNSYTDDDIEPDPEIECRALPWLPH